ncbi:MAG: dephospho-CoA kinase, partial [Gemmatimonadota bacterium]
GERGAVVIDADLLAREAVAPGTPGFRQVVDSFGSRVVGPDGSLDRAALAADVFAEPARRADLERITHPEVARLLAERVEQHRDTDRVVVYDTPLLTELGLGPAFDVVVVVVADPERRVERTVRSRGMAETDVRARMASQATDEQRSEVADILIDNDGTVTDLAVQLDNVWRELVARGRART